MRVQTNGVLLNTAFLRLFDERDVLVGVSVDGDRRAHDLHRRRRGGEGSHADVSAGLARLTAPPTVACSPAS
ncbi:hypothetical protein [Actinomadura macra]|uniref:hypothetical protein n=1 Tax=Actinomadura macra TaxID=46164 RepID=UPI001FDF6D7A|nr:hypothetical protein [Actinomadura macra]